jgi:hypothetical protein
MEYKEHHICKEWEQYKWKSGDLSVGVEGCHRKHHEAGTIYAVT